eukprot:2183741-Amphidinium_carterae.1
MNPSLEDALFAMDHDYQSDENQHHFKNVSGGFEAFRLLGDQAEPHMIDIQSPAMQKIMHSKNLTEAMECLKKEVDWAADVQAWSTRWSTTMHTAAFLSCCIIYKFSLWLYCILYAIPNTGSTLLVALANDKRNDFIATTFAVLAMTSSLWLEDVIGEDNAEKIDPTASLLYSGFIVYTWVCMILESARVLSKRSVPEMVLAIERAVPSMLQNTPCSANSVKCYTTSHKHSVEIDLAVNDAPNTTYADVAKAMSQVSKEVNKMEDIERVIVTTSAYRAASVHDKGRVSVSYTHLRAHETEADL